jgi:hypothetical protein
MKYLTLLRNTFNAMGLRLPSGLRSTLTFNASRGGTVCAVITLGLLAGCDFLEIDPPIDEIPADQIYTNPETAKLAVNGLYTELTINGLKSIFWCELSYYTPMMADELRYNSTNFNHFLANTYNAQSSYIQYYWSMPYLIIYQCNSVIEGLEGSDVFPAKERDAYIGEAKFLRAYCHFILTNFFGDVPLIVTTDPTVTATLPRTPIAAVRQAIIDDLVDAVGALDGSTGNSYKATRSAAEALLSTVYLYQKDWSNAIDRATSVINTSGAILDELDNVFLRTGKEAIFKLNTATWSRTNYTWIGGNHSTTNSRVREELLNAFEEGDLRKEKWIRKNGNYYNCYKYKQSASAAANVAEDIIILRLAEQYLIRAEAYAGRAQGDDLKNAVADLNVIRQRAELSDLSANLSKDELLLAVEQERRVELFMENGHRWFDLVRTGRADAVLGSTEGKQWEPYKALLPIPQAQIYANPFLVQNPGYSNLSDVL